MLHRFKTSANFKITPMGSTKSYACGELGCETVRYDHFFKAPAALNFTSVMFQPPARTGTLDPPVDQKAGLPRITIIVVGKRHHTRFYPTTTEDADRGSNAPAGTVVDRGITEASTSDFFLQPHTAIQGTARPAHYIVILDEIFRHRYKKGVPLPPGHRNISDVVESLCQALCYTYGRATKAVSICAPVYYADILCERGRLYLKDEFDATPEPSTAGSVAGGAGQGRVIGSGAVEAHPKLRNSMFYI
ncbi:uncharacterized protein DNG_07054 [Cephalotrichum gorgonifer]|uniref:Piwi domain-containing protein n=1 Tax=Cephalotrichum gorgonifer TaxID=2041049 RepID=A0AAE8N2M1_9PEZI|nr:uncharacterized protein DNG_07054 [Cephalotrichum gorgonifer]